MSVRVIQEVIVIDKYIIIMNKFLTSLFVASIMVFAGNVNAQEMLTLEGALEYAYENSPSLLQSKLSMEQSELNLKAQRASLKTQFALDLNAFQYTRQNSYDNFNSQWYLNENMTSSLSLGISQPVKWTNGTISLYNDFSWQNATSHSTGKRTNSFQHDISLRIDQPLFRYNEIKMNLRELELSLENAQINYALQQLNIERNVTSAFYQVYQNQKSLAIAQDEYANQKQNYEIINNKVNAGLAAKEELFQAEVNLLTSESTVKSAEMTYESSKDSFKQMLGMDLNLDIIVLPNTDVEPIAIDANLAVQYALNQRMELRQHEITLEQDMFNIIQTKDNNAFNGRISARVGLNALGYDNPKGMYDDMTDNEVVGISFSIPIFDWGARKARIRSAELRMESDEISFDEEKKTIMIDVRQLCRNIPTLLDQIEIKKRSMENAELTYQINLIKYRNGNLTGMDLQNYQNQLTSATTDHTNAIISYKLELLNLKIQTLWDFQKNESIFPTELLSGDETKKRNK